MSKLWDYLSKENKEKLALLYEYLSGVKFIPPERGDRAIQCEPKIESLEEIDKLMRQKPGGH